jgi:polar amino acid transport system substrate-binding protein
MRRIICFFYIIILSSSLYAKTVLKDVTLQLDWKNQFEFAGFYAAKYKGYYKAAGLNVHIKEFQKGTNVIQDVLDKNNTYGITYSNLIASYLEGKPVVFLANFFKVSPLALAVQNDIQLPNQLAGKKVMGLSDIAYNIEFLMMFKDFGVNEKQMINVPPTFNINAFKAKKVDAIVIYTTNELYYLQRSGLKYNLFRPSNYGAEFYDLNLFTSRRQLLNHPEQVKEFVNASIKGWQYALTHKNEIIDLILKKYNTQHKSRASLEFEAKQTENVILPQIFPIGSIDEERVKRLAYDFEEIGVIPKGTPLDFDKFIYHAQNHHGKLTPKEQKFLQQKKLLHLCIKPDFMPISAIRNGKFIGISADFFHILTATNRFHFKLYPTKTWQESLNAVKEGKCDLLASAQQTPNRSNYLDFTTPYLTVPVVLATRIDKPYTYNFYSLKGKTLGVVKGYVLGRVLKQRFPDIHFVDVKNIQAGLRGVESGKLYGYVDNLMSLAYAIQHKFTGVIKISARTNYDLHFAIATRKEEPLLHQIFQKLRYNVSERQKQQIVNDWISVQDGSGIDKGLIAKIIIIMTLIIFAFAYHYYKLRRYSMALKKLSTTDSLTGVYNRLKTDEIIQKEYKVFQRYHTPCSIIMVDIDHFKNINDEFGHQVGDYVLQEVITVVEKNTRDTDMIGRWGGEEFFIVCPNSTVDQGMLIAEKICKKIAEHIFEYNVGHITASFGVGGFTEHKTIDDLIKDVDDALYLSKKSGRNRVSRTTNGQ